MSLTLCHFLTALNDDWLNSQLRRIYFSSVPFSTTAAKLKLQQPYNGTTEAGKLSLNVEKWQ